MARYSNAPDREITFEVRSHIGVITEKETGWNKELNLVSWNGAEPPKYDIRDWSPDHMHMSRGITLFEDEMRQLVSAYLKFKGLSVMATGTAKRSAGAAGPEADTSAGGNAAGAAGGVGEKTGPENVVTPDEIPRDVAEDTSAPGAAWAREEPVPAGMLNDRVAIFPKEDTSL